MRLLSQLVDTLRRFEISQEGACSRTQEVLRNNTAWASSPNHPDTITQRSAHLPDLHADSKKCTSSWHANWIGYFPVSWTVYFLKHAGKQVHQKLPVAGNHTLIGLDYSWLPVTKSVPGAANTALCLSPESEHSFLSGWLVPESQIIFFSFCILSKAMKFPRESYLFIYLFIYCRISAFAYEFREKNNISIV